MRQDFDLTNFTAGELSPRMKGRVDYQKYFNGCASITNMIVMPQGGLTRRPGTAFVEQVFDQANRPRLRRFQFSTLQSYMLEFGAGYVRVYKNDGLILNSQAIAGLTNNGAGLIRVQLASAAGIYTGNIMTIAGTFPNKMANGVWTVSNVVASEGVTGATNNGTGLVRIAVGDTSHFVTGQQVTVAGLTGTVEGNGTWPAKIVDGTHIDLQGSVFATAYTGGGTLSGNDALLVDLQGSVYAQDAGARGTATVPVQIPVPYGTADLDQLYFTQSDDTLFIMHPNYPTAALTRSSHVDWSYQPLIFRDGPYLDVNSSSTTLTVSASGYVGGRLVIPLGIAGLTYRINPGVTASALTLTASSTLGINASAQSVGVGFQASDVGRHLRIKLASSWAWTVIEQVLSPTQVTVTVQPTVYGGAWGALDGAAWKPNVYYPIGVMVKNGSGNFRCLQDGISGTGGGPQVPGAGATTTEVPDGNVLWNSLNSSPSLTTTFWQLGKWTPGVYPYVGTFWQQRLMLLGSNLQPNAIEGSVLGDFTNFAPTAQDGTVVDTNALSFVISEDQVNQIQWVKAAGAAQAAQLAIGTVGTEEILQAASTAQPLTPTNVQVYPETANGTAPIEPLRISKSLLFVDRPGRKLLEWTFLWQVNGYDTIELSQTSEHVTASGVVAMVYAQAPHRLVWLLLADGGLVACTYHKNEQIFAATRQVLGGQYYGGRPIVESIDVIASQDGSYDELWLSVLRTIDGVPTRTIEVLTPWFEQASIPQENACFLDCSLTNTLPTPAATLTITGLVNMALQPDDAPVFGGTASLAVDAALFTNANLGSLIRVAGGVIEITSLPQDAQHIMGTVLRPLANTAPAAPGAWTMSPKFTTAAELDYLDGETVGVLGDGADFGTQVVTGGQVTLPLPGATKITAGLPYASGFVTMPYEPQRAAAAASAGKAKRIDTMWMRFHESLGCNFGQRLVDPLTFATRDKVEALETRSAAMPMGQAPALFSGPRRLRPQGGYDVEAQMVVNTTSPLPLTVLSLFASAFVSELPDEGR